MCNFSKETLIRLWQRQEVSNDKTAVQINIRGHTQSLIKVQRSVTADDIQPLV